MTTTLSEGVKVPDVGSVNWAGDLEVNWNLLNGALANLSGNVKTDRDNTWTGEQSFTLPIVGSITGTASKAIADEDGTSIKTGYVNVAGSQTVTGQKMWSGNQFFTTGVYHRNNSYEIGNIPASNVAIPIYFTDKVNIHTGYIRNVILTTGKTQTELYARNKFTSGALSPTGTDVTSTLQVEVQSNGDKTLYFDGSIRNNVLPYATNSYSLGSSSYQWSAVYAQSYYYNGTAWGLDIDNHWKRTQILHADTTIDIVNNPSNTIVGPALYWQDNNRFWAQYVPVWSTDGSFSIELGISNWTTAGNQGYWTVCTKISKDFGTFDFYTTHGAANLGTSTNKWKTFNGINPGALSLPNKDKRIAIDTTGWTYTGSYANQILINNTTQTISGWLYIRIENTTVSDYVTIRMNSVSIDNPTFIQPGSSATPVISVLFPVVAGIPVYVYATKALAQIYLYECLGNV